MDVYIVAGIIYPIRPDATKVYLAEKKPKVW